MPLDAPFCDVENMARKGLSSKLKLSNFEITNIELLEQGELDTPQGKMEGKRYKISYRNHLPN